MADTYPCLFDRVATTATDPHYFHQAAWATDRIRKAGPSRHVDVGSDLQFVACLTAMVSVAFVDIRPPVLALSGLTPIRGSVLSLPFRARAVNSLSCLHVAEHVGLGRYGDPLDPQGSAKACEELQRVLSAEGNLLISLPVGRPRTCFNAHRVHAPRQVLAYLPELRLVDFTVVDDGGQCHADADLDRAATLEYGCGLFHLTRR
jgi:hypothetical protein